MSPRTSTRPGTSTARGTRSSNPSSLEKTGVTATSMTCWSNLEQLTSTPTRYTSIARRQSKPDQTAWLGRTSFFGLSRLGHHLNLSHQAQLILYVPRLADLTSLYAVEGDAREFHLLAGRSNAHIVPLMGGAAPPASNHLVSLSYEVLNDACHVREASPEICCLLLGSLGLPGCKEFLCYLEVTGMVPELLLFPTHHGLVLFNRHIPLFLPGPLSPGGQQHTVHGATRRCPVHPRACYELGQKSHRNADFTVGLVPSRSLFPAFLSRF